MARKSKPDVMALTNYAGEALAPAAGEQQKKSNYNPKSKDNLQTNHRPKSPTTYMQVNVYGFEDYLYRMARYNKKTTTKYVLSLIEKDAAMHKEEYEALQKLPEFNKPYRESPNRKKSD